MAVRTRSGVTRTAARTAPLELEKRLVLNQFMLGLFGEASFEELARGLGDEPEYEEWDENNVSRFYHRLASRFFNADERTPPGPSRDDLLRYDGNIVRHTLRISAGRPERIRWKYFQYLALLFAEIYLDRYFGDPSGLLAQLNEHVAAFNRERAARDQVGLYREGDLRKLAFWMATGSGKTLLMHVNILQYRHYLEASGRQGELNRVILLTPNEGLSAQHVAELGHSGLPAELFDKAGGGLFAGQVVEVIDIHKLADEMGEKTVAVDAFEGNNLVLVDEGHRGAGGLDWKEKRDRLCAEGFSFEYSATFKQALTAANKPALTQEYARCILFDYSYKYFYDDGYGKDYQILNLEEGSDSQHLYLVGSLLSFYQQQALYADRKADFAPYGIERPLWVFVGGSVSRSLRTDDKTDILAILHFLARFARDGEGSVRCLERLMSGNTGLTYDGRDVFAGRFGYLRQRGLRGEALYRAVMASLFNAAGGQLWVEELKGAEGELALRLGDSEPFGVINVGDARALARLCEDDGELAVRSRELGASLFAGLNGPESRINILIGSRKFTEGWNSWRVSSMGLMKIGQGEGAQIIQLFGRGVRLKGYGGGLKRSAEVPIAPGRHPEHIRLLETLNVYGVKADYMEQFQSYLREEGVPAGEPPVEIVVPVKPQIPDRRLKAVRLRKGADFKREAPPPALGATKSPNVSKVPLDWYPKLRALESRDARNRGLDAVPEPGRLRPEHLAWMDLDAVYFELVRYKEERGWHNLSLTRDEVAALLRDPSWYTLSIPAAELSLEDAGVLERRRMWREIAVALLKKYCDRLYKAKREEYEAPFREYYDVGAGDPNLIEAYQFQVPAAAEEMVRELERLKADVGDGSFRGMDFNTVQALLFDRHLYRPLVHLKKGEVKVKPAALNEGEARFVEDLRMFHGAHPEVFAGRELYLLRNLSRGKGIGFFEAGNFYPDFIMWLLDGDRQYVTFIDPKGIRNLEGQDDPKIRFHETIKEIERAMGHANVILNSFIVSNTPHEEVAFWLPTKGIARQRHVLFQDGSDTGYIETMIGMILGDVPEWV